MRKITTPIEGEWILPSHAEQRVPGVLRLEGRNIYLTLIGTLPERWSSALRFNPGVILGMTVSGVRVTLLQCSLVGSQQALGGPAVTTVRAFTALWGIHAATSHEVNFDELWVRYTGLESWIGESSPNFDWPLKGELRRPVLDLKKQLLSTAEMSIEVLLRTEVTSREYQLQASERAYVVFRPTQALSLNEYLKWARYFRSLLVIATSAQVMIEEVMGRCDVASSFKTTRAAVPVLGLDWSPAGQEPVQLYRHRFLFSLSDLGEEAESLVGGWARKFKLWEPTVNLYAFTAYRQGLVLEEAFLNSVRACECFHRFEIGGASLPPAQHDARVAEILKACPPHRRHWLEERLCYSNEPSLRSRLKDLWVLCGPTLTGLLPVQRSRLISRTVAARNYLTHFSSESATSAPPLSELPSLGRWWIILLEFALLLQSGLSRGRLEELAKRNRSFNEYRFLETRDLEYRNF